MGNRQLTNSQIKELEIATKNKLSRKEITTYHKFWIELYETGEANRHSFRKFAEIALPALEILKPFQGLGDIPKNSIKASANVTIDSTNIVNNSQDVINTDSNLNKSLHEESNSIDVENIRTDYLFRAMDLDKDGVVNFKDFIIFQSKVSSNVIDPIDLLSIIFEMYDADNDGQISMSDLKMSLRSIFLALNPRYWETRKEQLNGLVDQRMKTIMGLLSTGNNIVNKNVNNPNLTTTSVSDTNHQQMMLKISKDDLIAACQHDPLIIINL